MVIKVLGACCASCNITFQNIKKAAADIDSTIKVIQIDNIIEILKFKITQTPAIIIDDRVVSSGKDLNIKQATELILKNK